MEPVREFVIVGAGVSGLYCSLKLQTKYPSCKITVIEKLPRLGGRILTEKYEGHVMEYGPMRFEPELQKTFAKLICELKVPTKDFSPYNCSATPDLNNISFEEIQAIKKYAKLSPVFALLKYGLSRVLEDQWCVETDDMHNPGRDAVKEWIKKSGTFQGRFLHDHGLWDTLAHVLSKDAIDFMQSKGR
jgi:monoamine oxidase